MFPSFRRFTGRLTKFAGFSSQFAVPWAFAGALGCWKLSLHSLRSNLLLRHWDLRFHFFCMTSRFIYWSVDNACVVLFLARCAMGVCRHAWLLEAQRANLHSNFLLWH